MSAAALAALLLAALQAAPPAPAPAPAAPSLEDRVAALVGAGKCAEAKDAAAAAGDGALGRQVDELCGLHPSSTPARTGRGGGGGGGGGRRGGGSGGSRPGG